MNTIQNYGTTNFRVDNKLAFKAHIEESFLKVLSDELEPSIGKAYLERITRKIEKIPADYTIEGIYTETVNPYIRISNGGISMTHPVSRGGNKLDILENLLRKRQDGTTGLAEIVYRLFHI